MPKGHGTLYQHPKVLRLLRPPHVGLVYECPVHGPVRRVGRDAPARTAAVSASEAVRLDAEEPLAEPRRAKPHQPEAGGGHKQWRLGDDLVLWYCGMVTCSGGGCLADFQSIDGKGTRNFCFPNIDWLIGPKQRVEIIRSEST